MVNHLNDKSLHKFLQSNVLGRNLRNKVLKEKFSITVANFIKFPLKKYKRKKERKKNKKKKIFDFKHGPALLVTP